MVLSHQKKVVRIFLLLKNVPGKILVFHSQNAQILHLLRLDARRNKVSVKTTMMEQNVKLFLPTVVPFIQVSKFAILIIHLQQFVFGTLLAKIYHCVLK